MTNLVYVGENGVKPQMPWVVVKTDLDQKKHHKITGTDVVLEIENQYNENLRERNPNYAEVVYVSDAESFCGYEKYQQFKNKLKVGDVVCLQHFQLMDHSGNSQAKAIDDSGESLYLVDIREIYFKVEAGEPVMLSNYTLCERVVSPEITDGGIIIPETAQYGRTREHARANVRYMSDEIKDVFTVGDEIIFTKYADYELDFNGKTYLKISSDEVLARISNNELTPISA